MCPPPWLRSFLGISKRKQVIMPTERTKEMLCALCQLNKADATGSHFAPAWLIESTIGERDKEEAYVLDAYSNNIEVYFGRGNLKNSNPEIKKNFHVQDYIFCNDCEKKLGDIESEVAPFIRQRIRLEKYRSQFSVTTLDDTMTLKITKQFSPAIFHTFIYSVIWRICLQHRLDLNNSAIQANIEENIRYFLVKQLSVPIKTLRKERFNLPYPYTVFTANDIEIEDSTVINVDSEFTNPALFFVSSIMVLFHFGSALKYRKYSKRLPESLNEEKFANENTDEIKVLVVSKKLFIDANKGFINDDYEAWKAESIRKIALAKGISKDIALELLRVEIIRVHQETGLDWAYAAKMAVENLLAY